MNPSSAQTPDAQPSDEELTSALVEGDLSALGQIYMRHGGAVLRFLARTVGNEATAEDLCQEVFVALPRAVTRYREGGKLRSWLLGIAAKKARSWQRRQWVRSRLLDSFQHFTQMFHAEGSLEPAVTAEPSVEQAFMALSPEHREVLLLQVSEGMTGTQIAEFLSISHSSVRVRLHRARKELGRLLEGQKGSGTAVVDRCNQAKDPDEA